jgi:hypothetical protein
VDLDPETFTARTDPSTLNRTMGVNMLGSEGPDQQRVRRIAEPAFRPRDVEERTRGMIPRLASELIDGFVARGTVDLFRAFCDPMSVRSLRFLLGLDEVPWEDILRWNEGMMPGLANFEGDPGKQSPADEASAALGEAIDRVLRRLETRPDGSVLSWMLSYDRDGVRMSRKEVIANTKLMLSGGLQEPRDLIALTMWAVLSTPGAPDALLADASLVRAAVEETLRWGRTRWDPHAPNADADRARRRRPAGGSVDRRRPRIGEPRSPQVHRPGSLRRPSQGGRASRVRRGNALLPRRVVPARPRGVSVEMLLDRLPGLRLHPDRPVECCGWEFRAPMSTWVRWDAA